MNINRDITVGNGVKNISYIFVCFVFLDMTLE